MARRRTAARQEIQQAARAVLLRDGVAGLTLEAVAREAGVTKQGLLYHFASKEELVFEIWLEECEREAAEIAAAVEAAADGGAALEAIIRTYVERYAKRLDVFRLVMQQVQLYDAKSLIGSAQIARIRPLNEQLYGGAERKVAAQRRGRRSRGSRMDPRRLAFCAYAAAIGIVAIKALVEKFGDPLKHSDEELITQMGAVFRAAAATGEPA
ncbi:MAG: helix-turn-helix domain-containing protein [bacterium]